MQALAASDAAAAPRRNPFDACDRRTTIARDIGGFARPRREGAQARCDQQIGAGLGGDIDDGAGARQVEQALLQLLVVVPRF